MAVLCVKINLVVQEQLPVEAWGPDAITLGFAGRANGDSYRILAAYDDTTVTITGTVVTDSNYNHSAIITSVTTNDTVSFTTNSGGYYDLILEGPAVFHATQPIQVAHFSNGVNYDNPALQLGDPCETLLQPAGQYLRTNIVITPTYVNTLRGGGGFPTNFLNIVVTQSAVTNTSLDGMILSATNFVTIATSGYYGAQISVTNGIHMVVSSQPVGVEVYGFGIDDAYGYFGGVVK